MSSSSPGENISPQGESLDEPEASGEVQEVVSLVSTEQATGDEGIVPSTPPSELVDEQSSTLPSNVDSVVDSPSVQVTQSLANLRFIGESPGGKDPNTLDKLQELASDPPSDPTQAAPGIVMEPEVEVIAETSGILQMENLGPQPSDFQEAASIPADLAPEAPVPAIQLSPEEEDHWFEQILDQYISQLLALVPSIMKSPPGKIRRSQQKTLYVLRNQLCSISVKKSDRGFRVQSEFEDIIRLILQEHPYYVRRPWFPDYWLDDQIFGYRAEERAGQIVYIPDDVHFPATTHVDIEGFQKEPEVEYFINKMQRRRLPDVPPMPLPSHLISQYVLGNVVVTVSEEAEMPDQSEIDSGEKVEEPTSGKTTPPPEPSARKSRDTTPKSKYVGTGARPKVRAAVAAEDIEMPSTEDQERLVLQKFKHVTTVLQGPEWRNFKRIRNKAKEAGDPIAENHLVRLHDGVSYKDAVQVLQHEVAWFHLFLEMVPTPIPGKDVVWKGSPQSLMISKAVKWLAELNKREAKAPGICSVQCGTRWEGDLTTLWTDTDSEFLKWLRELLFCFRDSFCPMVYYTDLDGRHPEVISRCPYAKCAEDKPERPEGQRSQRCGHYKLHESLVTHIVKNHLGGSPVRCTFCLFLFPAEKGGFEVYKTHLQMFHSGKGKDEQKKREDWPFSDLFARGENKVCIPRATSLDVYNFIRELMLRIAINQLASHAREKCRKRAIKVFDDFQGKCSSEEIKAREEKVKAIIERQNQIMAEEEAKAAAEAESTETESKPAASQKQKGGESTEQTCSDGSVIEAPDFSKVSGKKGNRKRKAGKNQDPPPKQATKKKPRTGPSPKLQSEKTLKQIISQTKAEDLAEALQSRPDFVAYHRGRARSRGAARGGRLPVGESRRVRPRSSERFSHYSTAARGSYRRALATARRSVLQAASRDPEPPPMYVVNKVDKLSTDNRSHVQVYVGESTDLRKYVVPDCMARRGVQFFPPITGYGPWKWRMGGDIKWSTFPVPTTKKSASAAAGAEADSESSLPGSPESTHRSPPTSPPKSPIQETQAKIKVVPAKPEKPIRLPATIQAVPQLTPREFPPLSRRQQTGCGSVATATTTTVSSVRTGQPSNIPGRADTRTSSTMPEMERGLIDYAGASPPGTLPGAQPGDYDWRLHNLPRVPPGRSGAHLTPQLCEDLSRQWANIGSLMRRTLDEQTRGSIPAHLRHRIGFVAVPARSLLLSFEQGPNTLTAISRLLQPVEFLGLNLEGLTGLDDTTRNLLENFISDYQTARRRLISDREDMEASTTGMHRFGGYPMGTSMGEGMYSSYPQPTQPRGMALHSGLQSESYQRPQPMEFGSPVMATMPSWEIPTPTSGFQSPAFHRGMPFGEPRPVRSAAVSMGYPQSPYQGQQQNFQQMAMQRQPSMAFSSVSQVPQTQPGAMARGPTPQGTIAGAEGGFHQRTLEETQRALMEMQAQVDRLRAEREQGHQGPSSQGRPDEAGSLDGAD